MTDFPRPIYRERIAQSPFDRSTRESTSARQQQSRGGFLGRSSALRPPRGCSRAPSVRFLKTAVAVLFFWPRINFQNQFSKPIFTMGFWKSTKNRPGNWPANSKNRSQNRGRNWPGTGGGFCSQFSKPVPEPARLTPKGEFCHRSVFVRLKLQLFILAQEEPETLKVGICG